MSQKKIFCKLTVPETDRTTLTWLRSQDSISVSTRHLIHTASMVLGNADITCLPMISPASLQKICSIIEADMAEKQLSVLSDDEDILTEDTEGADNTENNTAEAPALSAPAAERVPKKPSYTIKVTKDQLTWLDRNLTVLGFKACKPLFNSKFHTSYSVADLRKICKEHKIRIRSAAHWNKADRRRFNDMHRKEIDAYLNAHASDTINDTFVTNFNNRFGVAYTKKIIEDLRYNYKRRTGTTDKALAESFFGKPVEDINWEEDGQKLLNKLQKDKSDMEKIVNAQPAYAYEK